MSRRCSVKLRVIKKDYIFSSGLVTKFINYIMCAGKKSIAENIFYTSLNIIKKELNLKNDMDSLNIFCVALEHVVPKVEVRSRRVGGATYQIPTTISENRSKSIGMRWLIEAARKRKGRTMSEKLAKELIDASDKNTSVGKSVGSGLAVKKREDTHRMAEANKAFSHYRW